MWELKVRDADPYIAASCPLRSVAGSERWDTMTAASWGSSTTYADRKTQSSGLWTAEGTWCLCLKDWDRHREIKQHEVQVKKYIKQSIWPHEEWMLAFSVLMSITSDNLCISCSVWVTLYTTKGTSLISMAGSVDAVWFRGQSIRECKVVKTTTTHWWPNSSVGLFCLISTSWSKSNKILYFTTESSLLVHPAAGFWNPCVAMCGDLSK